MSSCETCLKLYRLVCRIRAEDGHEYEVRQKRCTQRDVVITYPVDNCKDYERWERKDGTA